MAKIYTSARYQLRKYAAGNTQQNWDDAYNAANADERTAEFSTRLGAELPPPGAFWMIYRNAIWFSIPGDIGTIDEAEIYSKGVYCDDDDYTSGYMYDGTSLAGTVADYGDMLDLTTLIGTWYASGLGGDVVWKATFNETGLAFLESKAGGVAKVAFYSSDQPNTPYQRIWVSVNASPGTILLINALPGYIWVEATKLAYIDAWRAKRTQEGTATGTTGKIAGHLFVEGNYLHYIDSSGAERRILGATTGLSGKQPSQISVNLKQGGTELCYIDDTGAERCFEGST